MQHCMVFAHQHTGLLYTSIVIHCRPSLQYAGLHIQLGRPLHLLLQCSQCAATGGLAPAAMDQHAVSGLSTSTWNSAHISWLNTSTCCSLLLVSFVCLCCRYLSSRSWQEGHASHPVLFGIVIASSQLGCPMLCSRMHTVCRAVAVLQQIKRWCRRVQASFAL